MRVEQLKCAPELEPFFQELPMPKGINGGEEIISRYGNSFFSSDVNRTMEVLRRMQDFHDAINSGRFFLCLSQRESFKEIYADPIPNWASDWIKCQYLTSAIKMYNSAFDLYLQVNWLYYKLYKNYPKIPHDITTENLRLILEKCNLKRVTDISDKYVFHINEKIKKAIDNFTETEAYNKIHDLCNSMKHRQRIDFKELSKGKHTIYINCDGYNSDETLLVSSVPELLSALKDYHKKITILSDESTPFWNFNNK